MQFSLNMISQDTHSQLLTSIQLDHQLLFPYIANVAKPRKYQKLQSSSDSI
jgi:hypothetical protein